MVFYLKYRPQSLDQLIAQETVKQTLLSSFSQDKLSHAYIFVGPRGTGKTSTARILAKMVNCESNQAIQQFSNSAIKTESLNSSIAQSLNIPCNICSTCLSITDGSNLDLIEIDAASNRGIDDIRSLREKIKLAPSSAKKKVYIIDEVHMLTTEAFNALLKTLEEPPKHALFILATTDVGKVPQTILSRVQRLDFRLATTVELLEALSKIAKSEKVDIEEEALKLLAKKAEGSFRDAVKLLDQVSSIEGKITLKQLEETLKTGKLDEVFGILENMSKKDPQAGLKILHKLYESGVDIKTFTLSLMDNFRNMVFIKNGLGESIVESQYSEENFIRLKNLSGNFSNQDLSKILNLLQESLEKLKFASIQQLPLELVIVEVCGLDNSEEKKLDIRSEKIDIEVRESKLEDQISKIQPHNPSSNIQHPSSSDDILKLKEKWQFVLETIRPYNFSLEALLRSANISECSELDVIMEVPYTFHQRILESPKNKEILESIFSDILQRQIRVSTILGTRPQRVDDVVNIEIAADDEIIRAAAEIFSSDTVN